MRATEFIVENADSAAVTALQKKHGWSTGQTSYGDLYFTWQGNTYVFYGERMRINWPNGESASIVWGRKPDWQGRNSEFSFAQAVQRKLLKFDLSIWQQLDRGTINDSQALQKFKAENERQAREAIAQGVAEGATNNIPTIGINVRSDGNIDYASLIVDGKKKYESRRTDSLRPYVGKTVGIVRTGNGPAVAIGQVTIGEPIEVDVEKFNKLRNQHLVPQGSKFDIEGASTKYLYPMINPVRWDNEKPIKSKGIVSRKIDEAKLSVDVPNEDWLQEKIDYAKSKGRNSYGVPYMGSTTAGVVGTPPRVRVMRLASLPGMRNEQMNVRKNDLKWLMDYMEKTGKLPPMGNSPDHEYLPYIMVAYNGEAWVNEGNHRIMAAYRLNWQDMPIEIRYFDGGERIATGPMAPGKIGLA